MTTYIYCPECKTVNEARIDSLPLTKKKVVVCSVCGKKINRDDLRVRICHECGNELYVPYGYIEYELPCKARHEQARLEEEKRQAEEQARLEEEKRQAEEQARLEEERRQAEEQSRLEEERRQQTEQEKPERRQAQEAPADKDTMARLMREIPCQSCPNEILRIGRDGKYAECPNCHNTPSEAWIAECWRKLSGQNPDLIQWRDDTGKQIVHVDQRAAAVAPYSVLLVSPDHFAVFEADARRRTLYPEVYPIFKNPYTQEEKLKLLNEGQNPDVLSLGLGQRIIFFSEHEHELFYNYEFRLENDLSQWKVNLPFVVTMQMRSRDSGNIMRHAMDWTDDHSASEYLEKLVIDALRNAISRLIRKQIRENDEALQEIQNEDDIKYWIDETLCTEKNLIEITNDISARLQQKYGIILPHEIEIDYAAITAEEIDEGNG